MPVFAAALSVGMWLQMPTLRAALDAHASEIDARRAAVVAYAATLPSGPVRVSRCVAPVTPAPRFNEDDLAATNMEVVGPDTRRTLNMASRLGNDRDLYISGQVALLMVWPTTLQVEGRRMSRERIAAEIERPLAGNRYVLFYGTHNLDPSPDATGGATRVDAYLVDVASGAQLCEIGFVATADDASGRLLEELEVAVTAATTRSR
jgi:hypothetical protein